MTTRRTRLAGALAPLCIAVLGGAVLGAGPSLADPDQDQAAGLSLSEARTRVGKLYHQAEVASERYNDAREELAQARTRLAALRKDLDRMQAQVEEMRRQVVAGIVAQAQGQALSSAAQTALSQSPDAFLEQLVSLSQHQQQQVDARAAFAAEAGRLSLRRQEMRRELADLAATKQELGQQKATIDEKADAAAALLRRLKREAAARAAERAAERAAARETASRSEERSPAPTTTTADPQPAPAPAPAASGRAGAAVSYALAQVGDAYVYGAAGPSAFDCSGLTMMAWAQAGVSLPHSSSAQMGSGTPVSMSALQPGDLVFYYSPVSHVALYIGNGRIVHAANPSSGVTTAPVSSMPVSGAVRPG